MKLNTTKFKKFTKFLLCNAPLMYINIINLLQTSIYQRKLNNFAVNLEQYFNYIIYGISYVIYIIYLYNSYVVHRTRHFDESWTEWIDESLINYLRMLFFFLLVLSIELKSFKLTMLTIYILLRKLNKFN